MTREISLQAQNLSQTAFPGGDFGTILENIYAELAQRFPNQNVPLSSQPSSGGVIIPEIIAGALANFYWAMGRLVDENYKETARFRDTVVKVARNFGYKARGAIAPSVELTITLDSAAAATFTIPRGEVLSANGAEYQTEASVTFSAGETGPKTVRAFEAQTIPLTVISNGEPLQEFRLDNIPSSRFVVQGSVSVVVGGVAWTEVDILQTGNENIYEVSYGRDPVRILFGTGEVGRIPPEGSAIQITYKATLGTLGVVGAGDITAFDRTFNVLGSQVTPVVSNDDSTPGSDRQSLDSIKFESSNLFNAGERGVSISDIDAISTSYSNPTLGNIAKARLTIVRDATGDARLQTFLDLVRDNSSISSDVIDDLSDHFNSILSAPGEAGFAQVQILATDSIGRYVSATREIAQALQSYLNGQNVVCPIMRISVVDGSDSVYGLNTSAGIRYTSGVNTEEARASVDAQVSDAIQSHLIGRDFGVSLIVSDVYEILEAISGVESVDFRITGYSNRTDYPANIDDVGNLIIGDFEVITMGDLPVVSEVV